MPSASDVVDAPSELAADLAELEELLVTLEHAATAAVEDTPGLMRAVIDGARRVRRRTFQRTIAMLDEGSEAASGVIADATVQAGGLLRSGLVTLDHRVMEAEEFTAGLRASVATDIRAGALIQAHTGGARAGAGR